MFPPHNKNQKYTKTGLGQNWTYPKSAIYALYRLSTCTFDKVKKCQGLDLKKKKSEGMKQTELQKSIKIVRFIVRVGCRLLGSVPLMFDRMVVLTMLFVLVIMLLSPLLTLFALQRAVFASVDALCS